MIAASLLALLVAAQPADAPLPGELHNFADYVVGCDNGLTCEAVSLTPEPVTTDQAAASAVAAAATYGVIKAMREAGPNAPLVFTISAFEGTPARLLRNDDVIGARLVPAGEGEWRVEVANMRAFVDALYSDTLTVQNAAGTRIATLPINGFREALLYMDERQGRLQTAGAAMRAGSRPSSVVPAAPPLPVVQAAAHTTERPLALTLAELAQARRAQGCTEAESGGLNYTDQELYALGGGRTLVMMACGSGAYNTTTAPLIAWREGGRLRIEPAAFDVGPDTDDAHGRRLLTNAEFDPATLSAHEWAKGRGLGDCGIAATYQWDGTRFRLIEQNEMSECRQTLELITTWRARVAR